MDNENEFVDFVGCSSHSKKAVSVLLGEKGHAWVQTWIQGGTSSGRCSINDLEKAAEGKIVRDRGTFMIFLKKSLNVRSDTEFCAFISDGEGPKALILLKKDRSSMEGYGIELVYEIESQAIADELRDSVMCLPKDDKDHPGIPKGSGMSFGIVKAEGPKAHQLWFNNDIVDLFLAYADVVSSGKEAYHCFTIKNPKTGKKRDIVAPCDEIKVPLQNLNVSLQNAFDKTNIDFQVAYKKGKSIVDNAKAHVGNKYMFKLDLHHFFPSCKRPLVEKKINFLFSGGDKAAAQKRFLDIILKDDALFIGSPISGTIANSIISKPVAFMKSMCAACSPQIAFTVYADDMTMSSEKFISDEFAMSVFRTAFMKYGMDEFFALNKDKSIGLSNEHRRVTGVSINGDDKMTCRRAMYERIRQELHELSCGRKAQHGIGQLRGQIAFALMVDESGKMRRLMAKYGKVALANQLISKKRLREVCPKPAAAPKDE
jgi:RNA-directed DNA polymerase